MKSPTYWHLQGSSLMVWLSLSCFKSLSEVVLQKYRFSRCFFRATVAAAILLACWFSTSPALADGPYGTASAAERLGCQSEGYDPVDTWSLRLSGDAYPGIGHVKVLVRPSPSDPSNNRICAITYHGNRTWGDVRRTVIEVGSEPKGNGTQDIYFWDRGDYRYHTDGRAITPGEGRCAVIHAFIKSADGTQTYQVWIDQNDVPDSLFCN